MAKFMTALLGGAALLVASNAAMAAEKCDVIHWWTSGSEAAAVGELAKLYNAAGGEWVDTAIAGGGGDNAKAVGIPRIMAGDSPCAMQFNYGKQFDELVANGLIRQLDSFATEGGWEKALPPIIWNQIRRDGHVYAVPVNIHGSNWSWWSKAALEKVGYAEAPKSWDEYWQILDKLKAAGVTPIASSGQSWQLEQMWQFYFLSIGGKDLFKQIYTDHSDDAVNSDAFKAVISAYLKSKNYVDNGAANRNWNDATSMVINATAGVQFMGDWAKGEFAVAGKTAGTDFFCKTTFSDNKGYIFGGDIMAIPVAKDKIAGQDKLINIIMSKEGQVAFNSKKGSAPVRLDVDTSKVDECGKQALALIADPAMQVPGIDATNSPDGTNAMRDVLATAWTDPNATTDSFIAKFLPAMHTDD